MIANFFQICFVSAPLKVLLGDSPMRVYGFGMAPQDVARPYVVWQPITGAPENNLSEPADSDSYSLQVDVYADTEAQAVQVAQALRDAVEESGNAYVGTWNGLLRDTETQLSRFGMGVELIVLR